MAVQFWTGVILIRSGAIALDPRCCCGEPDCSACATLPDYWLADFTGTAYQPMSLYTGSGCAALADVFTVTQDGDRCHWLYDANIGTLTAFGQSWPVRLQISIATDSDSRYHIEIILDTYGLAFNYATFVDHPDDCNPQGLNGDGALAIQLNDGYEVGSMCYDLGTPICLLTPVYA
jgi:hypothetical protein